MCDRWVRVVSWSFLLPLALSACGQAADDIATDADAGSDGSAAVGDASTGPLDFSGDIGPTAVDPVIAAMPPNSWKRLSGTQMSTVCPTSLNHYPCDYVTAAWGGGAYDSLRDRIVIFGGGHADSFYNNVFTFDLGAVKWTRHTQLPAALDNLKDGAPIPDVFTDKRIESCGLYPSVTTLSIPDAWLTPTGYLTWAHCEDPSIVAQLDAQQPRSTHTYGNVAFSPTTAQFYNLGSSAIYISGQTTSNRNMAFDFQSGQWSKKANNDDIAIGACSATDGAGRIWYARTGVLKRYDPGTDQWTGIASGADAEAYYCGAAVDTNRNKLVVTETGATIQTWDLSQPAPTRTAATTTGLATPIANTLGFEYDKAIDRFVAWNGGSTIYMMTPDTHVWTTLSPTGDVPTSPAQVYGRFRYSPLRNVFVLVTSTTEDVLVYKPPFTAP